MPDILHFSYFITPDLPDIYPDILSLGEKKRVAAGAQVSNRGDRLSHIYYIQEGELALNILSADGKERSCMFVRKSMFYGEAHLYKEFPTLFRVVATMPTMLIGFSLQLARTLIDSRPEFRIALFNGQAQKIFSMTGELVSLMSHSPEERVLHCLHDIAQCVPPEHGAKEFSVSQQTIARILGMHRVTVANSLASLKKNGHILYRRGRVTLLSSDR